MEILLNLAWAICSLGLVWFWVRSCGAGQGQRRIPLRTQVLTLAMIVLLLLPVISLSDDLMAMQGATEADACLRRALHVDNLHPSVAPSAMALQEQELTALLLGVTSRYAQQEERPTMAVLFAGPTVVCRPPPVQA